MPFLVIGGVSPEIFGRKPRCEEGRLGWVRGRIQRRDACTGTVVTIVRIDVDHHRSPLHRLA